MSMSIKFDLASFGAAIDARAKAVEDAARPAAQAGAEVLYRAVKANVAKLGSVTGNLADSIYQVYSKDNSGDGKAMYHVSWNSRKAPHGHLVEYGYLQRYPVYLGKDGHWYSRKDKPLASPRQVAAKPFVRPAAAQYPAAIEAARQELHKRLAGGEQ